MYIDATDPISAVPNSTGTDRSRPGITDLGLTDLNLVVLCGRVACDPDLRTSDCGARMLRILVTIRSDHPRKRIDVIPVSVWDPEDTLIEPGLAVGSRIWITGVAQRRFSEGPEGRSNRLEVVAQHVVVKQPAADSLGR